MGPEAGRFLSADPVHGSMGDGQSWNRYAYAGNDPVNRIDPLGLRSGSPTPFHRSYEAPFWATDMQTGAIFGGGVDMPLWFNVDNPETFYGGWDGFYGGAGAAGGAWEFAGWKHGPCYTTTSYVWDADVGGFVFALEVRCPNDRPVFAPGERPVAPPNPPGRTKPWKWEKTGSYNSLTFPGYDFWENLRMAPAGAPCECWWVKMPCDAPVLRSGTIANPESAVSFPPGDPPPGVQVTRALMFSDRNNPEARNRCPCVPPTPFPGCR
jgi:hypothetical protein